MVSLRTREARGKSNGSEERGASLAVTATGGEIQLMAGAVGGIGNLGLVEEMVVGEWAWLGQLERAMEKAGDGGRCERDSKLLILTGDEELLTADEEFRSVLLDMERSACRVSAVRERFFPESMTRC